MLRRLPAIVLGGALVIAAFSTGADFLFFLLYLGLLVVGGSYLVTRFGLADLEAGYALDRLNGQVGEPLRVTYTIRNAGRLPKLWLEAFNPSTLPVPLPGRALVLGPRAERSWAARVPLVACPRPPRRALPLPRPPAAPPHAGSGRAVPPRGEGGDDERVDAEVAAR